MLKNISRLQCKVNDREFQFYSDNDAPLHEVKEALFQFQKFVGEIEDRIKAAQKEKSDKETPPEVVQEQKPQE